MKGVEVSPQVLSIVWVGVGALLVVAVVLAKRVELVELWNGGIVVFAASGCVWLSCGAGVMVAMGALVMFMKGAAVVSLKG